MNQILKATDSSKKVFVKDMLFATLDTYTRRIKIENFPDFLLSDTIGFINNLHHTLIDAFKSTLQEVYDSDLLLHIIDISNPNHLKQKSITENTLKEIGAHDLPIIKIYNKVDLLDNKIYHPDSFTISAYKKEDIKMIIDKIKEILLKNYQQTTLFIPYEDSIVLNEIFTNNQTEIIEKDDTGYTIETHLNKTDLSIYKNYIKKN